MISVKKFFCSLSLCFHVMKFLAQKIQNELQSPSTSNGFCGGAVAEWSKALLKRDKLSKKLKIPGLGNILIDQF